MIAILITLGVVLALTLLLAIRKVRVAPQTRAGVVSRLGRYERTVDPGLSVLPVRRPANASPHGRRGPTPEAVPGVDRTRVRCAIQSPRRRSTHDALLDEPA